MEAFVQVGPEVKIQVHAGQWTDRIRPAPPVKGSPWGVKIQLVGHGWLMPHVEHAVQLLDHLMFAHFNDGLKS
jgi:hypothetical protein